MLRSGFLTQKNKRGTLAIAVLLIFVLLITGYTVKAETEKAETGKEPVILDDIEIQLIKEKLEENENVDIKGEIKDHNVSENVIELFKAQYPNSTIEFSKKEEHFNFTENGAINLEITYDVIVDGKPSATFVDYIEIAPNVAHSKKTYKAEKKPVTEASIQEALVRREKNIMENREHVKSIKIVSEEEKIKRLQHEILIRNVLRKLAWVVFILITTGMFVFAKKRNILKKIKLPGFKINKAPLTIFLVVLTISMPILAQADHIWRYNYQRTGYVTEEMVLPYRLVKTISGFGASGSTPVIIGDDELYVTDNTTQTIGRIHLEGASSYTVWQKGTFTGGYNNGVVYGDYYIFANNDILEVRNRNNGNVVHSAKMTGRSVNDPLIIGNYVYITTIAGYIHRYTLPNLTDRRDYKAMEFPGHVTSVRCAPTYISSTRIAIVSSAVNNKGNREGEIIVLDQNLGLVGKSRMIAGAIATPVYYGGKLYVHDYRGHVYRANTSGVIEATRSRPHDGTPGAAYYTAQSSGATDGSYYYWPIKTANANYTQYTGIYKIPLWFNSDTAITAYKQGTWPTSSLTISKTNYGDTIFYMTNDGYLRAIYASTGSENTHAFAGGNWSIYVSGVGDFSSPVINGGVGGYIVLMSGGGVRILATDDNTAPDITANPTSSDWTNNNISVNLTVTDKGDSATVGVYRIWSIINTSSSTPSVNSSEWGNPKYSFTGFQQSLSWTETISSTGVYYIHVKAIDRIGNVSTKTFGPYRVDKALPTVSFNPSSGGWTNSNISVTISASDTGGSGLKEFYYRTSSNNGASWSGWNRVSSSSTGITFSSEGVHKIEAYAVDNVGNTGSTATSGSYLIDKTPPAHVSHSISGYRYVSGNVYWVRPNDIITIKLRGQDNLSNISCTSLLFTGSGVNCGGYHEWFGPSNNIHTSDWSAPDVAFVSATRTYDQNNVREVAIQAQPKTHGHSYAVKYYYYDNAWNGIGWGNTGITVSVDGVGPSVTFSPNSHDWTRNSITITISAGDNAGGSGVKELYYRTSSNNGSTWGSWNRVTGSSAVITLSSEGQHRIQAYAVDNVDNKGNTVTSGTYRIDKTAPSVTFNPNGSETWAREHSTVVTITDSSSGINPSSLRYIWSTSTSTPKDTDNWIYFANGSRIYTPVGVTGDYYLHVKAEDNTGNLISARSNRFRVDNTPPTPPEIELSTENWTNSNVTVTLSGGSDAHSGVARLEYRINGGDWKTYTSPFIISNEGVTTVEARAIDNAGNVSDVVMKQAKIDKTVPTAPQIFISPSEWTNNTVVVFIIPGLDDLSDVNRTEYRINNGSWITYSTAFTISTEGVHTIEARTVDNAGNFSAISRVQAKIDKTAPEITVTPPSRDWANTNVTVTITYTDSGGSGLVAKQYAWSKMAVEPTEWKNYTAPVTQTAEGEWYLYVKAVDRADNTTVKCFGPYRIDKTAPEISAEPPERGWEDAPVTVNIEFSDTDGSGIKDRLYAWSNNTDTPTKWNSYNSPVTQSAPGVWYLHAKVTDNAGNETVTYFGPYIVDELKHIEVIPATVTIVRTETLPLLVRAVYHLKTEDVTTQAQYTSSNTTIVTVNSSGVITGKAVGQAVVTATYKGKQAQCTVTVQEPEKTVAGTITISKTPTYVFTKFNKTPSGQPSNMDITISWSNLNLLILRADKTVLHSEPITVTRAESQHRINRYTQPETYSWGTLVYSKLTNNSPGNGSYRAIYEYNKAGKPNSPFTFTGYYIHEGQEKSFSITVNIPVNGISTTLLRPSTILTLSPNFLSALTNYSGHNVWKYSGVWPASGVLTLGGSSGELEWPVPGNTTISSYFGRRIDPIDNIVRMHYGIDIPAPEGANIIAPDDGKVIFVGQDEGFGNMLVIRAGSYDFIFGHCSRIEVTTGQTVRRGQIVAKVGSTGRSTGPHLDFRVTLGPYTQGNYIDPLTVVKP